MVAADARCRHCPSSIVFQAEGSQAAQGRQGSCATVGGVRTGDSRAPGAVSQSSAAVTAVTAATSQQPVGCSYTEGVTASRAGSGVTQSFVEAKNLLGEG